VCFFIIVGLVVALLVTIIPPYKPLSVELGTMWILFFTLVVVTFYFYETKHIAEWGPRQFRALWIAEIFRNFSVRIDACLKDLQDGKEENMNTHEKDIERYFRVLEALWPKRPEPNVIENLKKKFWNDWKKNRDKQECLRELQEDLQIKVGKLAELPDP